jgi:hypothetical protein
MLMSKPISETIVQGRHFIHTRDRAQPLDGLDVREQVAPDGTIELFHTAFGMTEIFHQIAQEESQVIGEAPLQSPRQLRLFLLQFTERQAGQMSGLALSFSDGVQHPPTAHSDYVAGNRS